MSALNVKVEGAGLDVGFLCHGWPPLSRGGVETHAQDLARELVARGHRVHVLTLDTGEGLEPYTVRDEEPAEPDIAVRRMAYRYQDHGALADVVRSDRASDVVHAWLAETPCDVVHVHHLTGFGTSALRAIFDVGQPLVVTLHDYWSLCPRGQMLRSDGAVCARAEAATCAPCIGATWGHLLPSQGARPEGPDREPLTGAEPQERDEAAAAARTAYALECLALPHRLYTPSEAARRVYVAHGIPAERIAVVENGIRAETLRAEVVRARAAAEARGEARTGLRLGVLGSVQPSKGVLELARAVLAADVPGLTLEVHGPLDGYHGDTSYVDALRELAAGDGRIRLHGPFERTRLAEVLAGLDAVAAPSRWNEVFGLTVREARAAGLPVLVSDAGGLASAAEDGAAGLVVPRDDPAAWRDAIRAWATDPALRERFERAVPRVRTVREMMLQLERSYVETIVELTGLEPELVHPLEGAPPPSAAPAAPSEAGAPAAAAEPKPKKGFLRRLFGG